MAKAPCPYLFCQRLHAWGSCVGPSGIIFFFFCFIFPVYCLGSSSGEFTICLDLYFFDAS